MQVTQFPAGDTGARALRSPIRTLVAPRSLSQAADPERLF